jgi:hypothetical protein
MPWSLDVGPLRYTQPVVPRRQSAWRATLLIMAGLAAIVVVAAVAVLYGLAIGTAWLIGYAVGMRRSEPMLWAGRYATAVTDWGRSLVRD